MTWIDANDVTLRYRLEGRGRRTVVLIHEMGGTLESWDGVVERLAGDFTILRYDMRGHGLSQKIRGPFALADAVADLRGLMDGLLIERACLAGIAVGGGIALAFAAAHPDRVETLIACAPATGIAADRRAATLTRIERVEQNGMRDFVDNDMLPGAYPDVLRTNPDRFAEFRARQIANDPASYGATYRMLLDADFTPVLPRIDCPTLIIAGRHDKGRSPEVTARVARAIPDARFQVLETGHFMAEQTPALLAATMTDFLSEA